MIKNKKFFLFDVDNTLYPAHTNLFQHIDNRINNFLKEVLDIPENQVNKVRKDYLNRYGTTLNGLMKHYHVDPIYYLEYVHNVEVENFLKENNNLKNILKKINCRKIIFSNAYKPYIQKVLHALGIKDFFTDIIDIVETNFNPKPLKAPYIQILSKYGFPPDRYLMIDDSEKNLTTAKDIGFTTILIGKKNFKKEQFDYCFEFIEEIEKIIQVQNSMLMVQSYKDNKKVL